MENAGYLLAAFAVVWAVLFGYLVVLFHRQKQLRRDIDSLKIVLTKKDKHQS